MPAARRRTTKAEEISVRDETEFICKGDQTADTFGRMSRCVRVVLLVGLNFRDGNLPQGHTQAGKSGLPPWFNLFLLIDKVDPTLSKIFP